jgi:cytochrome c oxidase subunit 3
MAIGDEVFTLSIYAWSFCSYVLCSINDFILIFSSVTMVLAVDAGHQMKKDSCFMFFNHYRWWIFVGSQAWNGKTLSKEYGAIETKGGSLLSLLIKMVIVLLADFAATLPEVREQLTRDKGNGLWKRCFAILLCS